MMIVIQNTQNYSHRQTNSSHDRIHKFLSHAQKILQSDTKFYSYNTF